LFYLLLPLTIDSQMAVVDWIHKFVRKQQYPT
jgi:hypothetical protein